MSHNGGSLLPSESAVSGANPGAPPGLSRVLTRVRRGQGPVRGGAAAGPQGDRCETEGGPYAANVTWVKIKNRAYSQMEGGVNSSTDRGNTESMGG